MDIDWIDDRLPTEADADDEGKVVVPMGRGWQCRSWADVVAGERWAPRYAVSAV